MGSPARICRFKVSAPTFARPFFHFRNRNQLPPPRSGVQSQPAGHLGLRRGRGQEECARANDKQLQILLSVDLSELEKQPWSKGGTWDTAKKDLALLATGAMARHEMMAFTGACGDKEGQPRTPVGVVKERMDKCWRDSGYNSVADLNEDVGDLCDDLAGKLKTSEGITNFQSHPHSNCFASWWILIG